MAMWNDYEKIARRVDRIANAFERIANALETANIIEADRKTEPMVYKMREPTEEERQTIMDCIEDEPSGDNLSAVETMSCAECIHKPIGAEICEEPCHYEPQTERSYKK